MKKLRVGAIYGINRRYLYPLNREHLSRLKDWRNSQMTILRQWKPLTDHNQEKWFQQVSEDDTQIIFTIFEEDIKGIMRLIGYCGITNIDFRNRRGEISFLLDPNRIYDKKLYREDFITTLYMLCTYGFERLNLYKLYTETFSFRRYHIEILEKYGFQRDGILRAHHFVNGTYYDSVIHSLLQEEWYNIKEKISRIIGGEVDELER